MTQLLVACMAKNPADRPTDLNAFAAALNGNERERRNVVRLTARRGGMLFRKQISPSMKTNLVLAKCSVVTLLPA